MTGIKCFWLEPTDKEKRYLRRYITGGEKCSASNFGYHNAMNFLDESYEVVGETGCWVDSGQTAADFKGHPLWPTHCACGYEFQDKDEWQVFGKHIYRRLDTGEEMTLQEAPEGAMWDAAWFHGCAGWCGEDGRSIICKVPHDRDWMIDGTATNCNRPDEPHKCWVRHGEPPNLTVDKNGITCGAGGGSILTPEWHGFLRNGELVSG